MLSEQVILDVAMRILEWAKDKEHPLFNVTTMQDVIPGIIYRKRILYWACLELVKRGILISQICDDFAVVLPLISQERINKDVMNSFGEYDDFDVEALQDSTSIIYRKNVLRKSLAQLVSEGRMRRLTNGRFRVKELENESCVPKKAYNQEPEVCDSAKEELVVNILSKNAKRRLRLKKLKAHLRHI